jgi:hypothetical protein
MSITEVNRILLKHGFQGVDVQLPAQFGADPPGYQYPCWMIRGKYNVTSTFKNGKLVDFSWRG